MTRAATRRQSALRAGPFLAATILLLGTTAAISAAPRGASDVESLGSGLENAAAKGDLETARRVVRELGASEDAAAAEWLFKATIAFDDAEVIEGVIAGLRRLGVERIGGACESALDRSKTHPYVVAVIIAAAEGLDDERSERWIVDALRSKDELILRNAIDALVVRKSKAGIPALIDLLDRIGDRRTTTRYAVTDALIDLTGQEFETIEDWRKFWDANGAGFDPKELDDEGTTGVVRKRSGPRGVEFFGVEVVSQRVMFVIDTSGSMVLYDEGEPEEGSAGGPSWKTRQRILRVRAQLKSAIENLPSGARFNIIAFDETLKTFNDDGIVPANAGWKKRGGQFADGLRANGATHTDEAMRAAFRDKQIDTIILLTDGAPVHRDSREYLIPKILDEVRRLNRIRKVKIYTFGFDGPGVPPPESRQRPNGDPDSLVDFLRRLAEENGGTYTSIR